MTKLPACKSLVLVRHGSTMANEEGMVVSDEDPGLSDRGTQQVALLKEWFEQRKLPDVSIVSSAKKRAIQTADLLNECFHEAPALNERDLGPFAGATVGEIVQYKQDLGLSIDDPTLLWEGVEGVESDSAIFERVMSCLLKQDVTDTILCVSHAGVLKAVTYRLLGIPPMTPYAIKFSLGSALVFTATAIGFELTEYWMNPLSKGRGTP